MQLNIYLISHPIIQMLSSQILYNTSIPKQIYNQNYRHLGILLIYEIVRKWLNIKRIYIKYIDKVKDIYIFDKDESYLIITDLINSHNMVTEAIALLPNTNLQHVHLNQHSSNINNTNIYSTISNTINNKQKIILMYPYIDNYAIIHLLDYLILKKHVKINQIKIICIVCHNKILENIGKKYPNLNIYTTKIMNN